MQNFDFTTTNRSETIVFTTSKILKTNLITYYQLKDLLYNLITDTYNFYTKELNKAIFLNIYFIKKLM